MVVKEHYIKVVLVPQIVKNLRNFNQQIRCRMSVVQKLTALDSIVEDSQLDQFRRAMKLTVANTNFTVTFDIDLEFAHTVVVISTNTNANENIKAANNTIDSIKLVENFKNNYYQLLMAFDKLHYLCLEGLDKFKLQHYYSKQVVL